MTGALVSSSIHQQSSFQPSTRPSAAGSIVAGVSGGIAIISIVGLLGAPLANLSLVSADARLWIAYGLLAVVSLLSGLIVAIWRAPSGLVAAALAGVSADLFLWLMRVFLLDDQPYNRLVFGWPGMTVVPVAALLGGGIAHLLDDDRLHERLTFGPATRVGLWAACLWVTLEFVARLVGAAGIAPALGNVVAGDAIAIGLGMVAAAWIVARYGQANGVAFGDWSYHWTPSTVGLGAVSGALAVGLMWVTSQIDLALWVMPADALTVFAVSLQAGAWVAALLLVANALVAPICEEIAWRGVVQTALVRGWGPLIGIGLTAILFAMKHALLDGTFARITTLLMLGLVFGVVRHRWGTGASTVTHVVVNLYATAVIITTA
jgi:membrane protease YdiL (CAAX protease family)